MAKKETPILIDEAPITKTKIGKQPKMVVPRAKKKIKWGRFIEFDLKQTKEKIRFAVTYVLVGVALFFAADVFKLISFKITAGIMVFVGIVAIIVAIAVPIVQLVRDGEAAERERRGY